MIVEGKGCVAPNPVAYKCSKSLVELCITKAKEREQFHGYRYSSSSYKRGLAGSFNFAGVNIEKSISPVFAGILGEYVVSEWLKSKGYDCTTPDVSLRSIGDDGFDLVCRGKTIDVKTRIGGRRSGEKDTWEVTRVTGRKKLKGVMSCELYVFCSVADRFTTAKKVASRSSGRTVLRDVGQGSLLDALHIDPDRHKSIGDAHQDIVLINGWMYADEVANCTFRKSNIGDNYNLSVKHRDIRGINDLIDFIELNGECDVD